MYSKSSIYLKMSYVGTNHSSQPYRIYLFAVNFKLNWKKINMPLKMNFSYSLTMAQEWDRAEHKEFKAIKTQVWIPGNFKVWLANLKNAQFGAKHFA